MSQAGGNHASGGHGRAEAGARRYVDFLWRWRWLVVLLAFALVFASAYNIRHIRLASDYRIFFSEKNPELTNYEYLERTYTKNDNIMFVLRARSGTVFSPQNLEAIWQLTEAAWQVPYTRRVDSITNFQYTRPDGDVLEVGDLLPDLAGLDAAKAADVRAGALDGPELTGLILSEDLTTTAVNVRVQLSDDARAQIVEAAAVARDIAADFRARHPEFELELSGFVMLSNAFAEAPRGDARTVIPLMYGIFALLLLFLLRSGWPVAAIFVIVIASAAAAAGLAGLFRTPLNPVSVMAPNIIVTVAIANSVHLVITALDCLRGEMNRHDAVAESMARNVKPVFLSALTTAIGFLSLNFSDAPPFWHLGNLTAAGVVIAWMLSMTVLPILLLVLPVKVAAPVRLSFMMPSLGEFVIRRARPIIGFTVLVAAALLAATPRLEINDRPFEYFERGTDIRDATEFTIEHLTGVYGISYSLESGHSGGISDAEYLRIVDDFATWLRMKPEVAHVSALTDILKRLNRDLHGGDPAYYRLPQSAEEAAQYLLTYEMSLPYGLDLNDRIDIDSSATRLDVTFRNIDFVILNRMADEANRWLADHGLEAMRDDKATSQAIMFSHISRRNISAMAEGTLLAFGAIALTLLLALRSVRLGLISLIPNLLPIAMSFGVWAVLNGRVNLAVSVVAGVSIGIIVDDTVHFLTKYSNARQRGMSAQDCVRHAFGQVGGALMITSIVIAAGFAALILSPFFINEILGLLTALTIVIALALDLLLLPALLLIIDRKNGAPESE